MSEDKDKETKMYGPYELEANIHLTNGEIFAVATVGLGNGHYPSKEDMNEAMENAETHIKERLGYGWRLCNRKEFFGVIVAEVLGVDAKIAYPGGDDWDD